MGLRVEGGEVWLEWGFDVDCRSESAFRPERLLRPEELEAAPWLEGASGEAIEGRLAGGARTWEFRCRGKLADPEGLMAAGGAATTRAWGTQTSLRVESLEQAAFEVFHGSREGFEEDWDGSWAFRQRSWEGPGAAEGRAAMEAARMGEELGAAAEGAGSGGNPGRRL